MKIIGVTGNIGCGKSTVCQIFSEKYNIPVFSADIAAKNLIKTDKNLIDQIYNLFGMYVFNGDMSINRKFIFDKVFTDKPTLDKYNAILHPPVIAAFDEWVSTMIHGDYPYLMQESALLFEAKTHNKFNEIISVNCDLNTRVKRASIRSGLTEDEVRLIDSNQINWIEKWRLSTLSILNTTDLRNLELSVDFIHQYLIY